MTTASKRVGAGLVTTTPSLPWTRPAEAVLAELGKQLYERLPECPMMAAVTPRAGVPA